jgi:hypothetical protein
VVLVGVHVFAHEAGDVRRVRDLTVNDMELAAGEMRVVLAHDVSGAVVVGVLQYGIDELLMERCFGPWWGGPNANDKVSSPVNRCNGRKPMNLARNGERHHRAAIIAQSEPL